MEETTGHRGPCAQEERLRLLRDGECVAFQATPHEELSGYGRQALRAYARHLLVVADGPVGEVRAAYVRGLRDAADWSAEGSMPGGLTQPVAAPAVEVPRTRPAGDVHELRRVVLATLVELSREHGLPMPHQVDIIMWEDGEEPAASLDLDRGAYAAVERWASMLGLPRPEWNGGDPESGIYTSAAASGRLLPRPLWLGLGYLSVRA
ncbi:MAG TPA: hypothetical protein VFM54_09245, partial [Micromonosporaceae bacterium]|nr:hypothetical protein [Micromonosporaceae bacterium]